MKKIINHNKAAEILNEIKDKAFEFIGKNLGKISEYDVKQHIKTEFENNNLLSDEFVPIVASGKNTGEVHYFAKKKSRKIRKDDLILIDLWGRLRKKSSVYADITWMGYAGRKPSKKVIDAFNLVISAREAGLNFVKRELKKKKFPRGIDIDKAVRDVFEKNNLGRYFKHSTGHSMSFKRVHAKFFNLSRKDKKKIKPNIPFTIEPGIYYKGRFGIRSEIDCYITKNYKLIVTTKKQNKLVLI